MRTEVGVGTLDMSSKSKTKREWDRYTNRQDAMECQLVTALNAYYYLTGKFVKRGSDRYDKLRKMCEELRGESIDDMSPGWRWLGIRPGTHWDFPPIVWKKRQGLLHNVFPSCLPLEISVWYKRCRLHSVCAVEYEPRTKCLRVPNFQWVTSNEGWIFIEDLRHYVTKADGWMCRQFEIGPVAQVAERTPDKGEVVGASPPRPTIDD